jgi:hypothetical protein
MGNLPRVGSANFQSSVRQFAHCSSSRRSLRLKRNRHMVRRQESSFEARL